MYQVGHLNSEEYKQIVWLASYPKSGNTWVRLFMDAYFMGEVNINEIVSSIGDDIALRHSIGDESRVQDLPIQIQQLTRPMSLLRLVHNYVRSRINIPLLVKTHASHAVTNGIEQLPECLTKATVFLVRDPRDVLPSYANHMGAESLDEALVWMDEQYRALKATETKMMDFISSWGFHTKSFLNADTHNVMVVKYEDLRRDPLTCFGNILLHAGVDPDIKRIEKALELCDLSRMRKQEREHGFKEGSNKAKLPFFGAGSTSGGKGVLEPRHHTIIKKNWGRQMKRLGYLEKVGA